ncbi:MAG: Smr/MutS family protein [Vicinamibacteria bacterium]|nr:Smr/MutS family protein [Vicinamibacteria bacterium]
MPITGTIDLHAFAPRDIPAVVQDYIDACRERGMLTVRLIHGRGKGAQRAVVRRVLASRDDVLAYDDAPPGLGGWGSTIARLHAIRDDEPER